MNSIPNANRCCRSLSKIQDLRLHRHIEGGRRLVRDQQLRTIDQGHGDHDALPLAAGKLVRVVADPALRLGNRNRAQGLEHRLAHLLAAQFRLVGFERFGDLAPDRHHRVQGRHRLLKDHGDLSSAIAPHLLCRQLEQILTGKADGAFHPRGRIEQAQDGQRGDGFPRSRFAHQSKHFSLLDGEAQIADCGAIAKVDRETVDFEERGQEIRIAKKRSAKKRIAKVRSAKKRIAEKQQVSKSAQQGFNKAPAG